MSFKSITFTEKTNYICISESFISRFFLHLIVSVTIVNVLSVQLAARTQILFTVIKVGGLLVIIGGGIYQLFIGWSIPMN